VHGVLEETRVIAQVIVVLAARAISRLFAARCAALVARRAVRIAYCEPFEAVRALFSVVAGSTALFAWETVAFGGAVLQRL